MTVVCRFRPFNESEKARGVNQAVEFISQEKCKILLPAVSHPSPILMAAVLTSVSLFSIGINGEARHELYF